jgi:uncharacterized protein (TIGR02145 family)
MKKYTVLLAFTLLFTLSLNAQSDSDTLYIMKNGDVVGKFNVNTQVDSIIFYPPAISPGNTFTDSRDGNVYQTVTIGNQVWMAENLKYLPEVVGPGTGSNSTPHYYVHGYDGSVVADAMTTANYDTYGVLYNWPAAMASSESSSTNPSGEQGICPAGWHLPSDAEWTELTDYLGGDAAGKLKESGNAHWTENTDTQATNETGFTALPGGNRDPNGNFYWINDYGFWWSSTIDNDETNNAFSRMIAYNSNDVNIRSRVKDLAYSVRCVKD